MPIYEYHCDECEKNFEELVLPRDQEPKACPNCDSQKIGRVISHTTFTLTGKGWYTTDYGGRNPGAVPTASGSSKNKGKDSP